MTSTFQAPSKIQQLKKSSHLPVPRAFMPKHYVDPDKLIFVCKPYNRLERIERTSVDSMKCIVFNEYQGDCEGGPIGTAEVGRHIAILGSIQLALEYNFGEKCFFLAVGAKLHRTGKNFQPKLQDSYLNRKFHLSVQTITADRKHAIVAGKVLDEGFNEVFTAEIKYMVTRKKVFERLFSAYRNTTFHSNVCPSSPYDTNRKELSQMDISRTSASGMHELVEPSECLGHFPEYPALPVAVMGNHFIQIGIKLFRSFFDYSYSSIAACESSLEAKRLVFSGESLKISAHIKESLPNRVLSIDAEATVKGEVVATANMLFQGIY